MKLDLFLEFLKENKIEYSLDAPMYQYTSFKIGGAADVLVSPADKNALFAVLNKCAQADVPYTILGRGSNLLVSDAGIDGAVISTDKLTGITVSGNTVICGAGASLSAVCREAKNAGLTGMEFAYGIPGSIGGALFMNAGAYGGEMSQIVRNAKYLEAGGAEKEIAVSDMALGYRTSTFKSGGMVIAEVTLALEDGSAAEIEQRMCALMEKRRTKQPLEYPSAGSTFKRPEGYFAGTLIEKNGLKGLKCGGAMVSVKHAGFIINTGGATCEDVKQLINQVTDAVFKADGVTLEPEVLFVGRK